MCGIVNGFMCWLICGWCNDVVVVVYRTIITFIVVNVIVGGIVILGD